MQNTSFLQILMLAIASVCWPFTELSKQLLCCVENHSYIWSNHTFCADSVDNIFWGIRETMPVYVLLCFLVCTAQHTQCRDSTDWGHWGLVHLTQRWASRLQLLRRRVQHAIAHFQKFWLKSNWKLKITQEGTRYIPTNATIDSVWGITENVQIS